jgi:hypothetical protein
MGRQRVVRGEQVVQIALARHRLALGLGPGMTAEVERQADAAQCGDFPRARQVLLLTSAPTMNEEHARHEHARQDKRPVDGSRTTPDLDLLFTRGHRDAPARIW